MRSRTHVGAFELPVIERYGIQAALVLAVILALKLALLFWLGPSIFPDSGGYIAIGDSIVSGTHWLDDSGWGTGPTPTPILRPYGYPLLIALAKLVAAGQFSYALAILQCIASVAALAVVAAVLPGFVQAPFLRHAIIVLAAASGSSLFDIAILSDSLYASLFTTVIFLIVADFTNRFRLGPLACAALGAAWGYSIWLRESGLYFAALPLLGLAIAGWLRGLRAAAIAGSLAAFMAPVLGLVALHIAWNAQRTGHTFLSVGDAINWLWPSFNIAAMGLADPFDGTDIVSRSARGREIGQDLVGMNQLMMILWQDQGLEPHQIAHVTFAHFVAVVRHHPLAYLASVARNLQFERLANYLLNPLANLNDFLQLGPPVHDRIVPALRELREMIAAGHWLRAAKVGLFVLPFEVIAAAGLAVLVIATPIAAIGRLRMCVRGADVAAAFLWLTFVALVGAFALVHFEMRYALPVVPAALASLGYCIDRWRAGRRQ
jgi:hypothetical protein